ncbi:MAG: glycogen-binding domain-containing protein [Gemmatimonadota bacterium]
MNARIHAYFNGELQASDLTSEELRIARRLQGHIETLRQEAGEFSAAQLESAVMNRISDLPGPKAAESGADLHGLAGVVRWFAVPKRFSVAVRPVYVVAVALLLFAVAWQLSAGSPESSLAVTDSEPQVFVRFGIMAPEAQSVRLVGSFTGWDSGVSLQRLPSGLWTALVALPPGVHNYAFRVDEDTWVTDPAAPRVADGFGGFNSQLSLIVASS